MYVSFVTVVKLISGRVIFNVSGSAVTENFSERNFGVSGLGVLKMSVLFSPKYLLTAQTVILYTDENRNGLLTWNDRFGHNFGHNYTLLPRKIYNRG